MKYRCNLCGEEFDDTEVEASNSLGDIIITCPNACTLKIVSVCDLPDVKNIES